MATYDQFKAIYGKFGVKATRCCLRILAPVLLVCDDCTLLQCKCLERVTLHVWQQNGWIMDRAVRMLLPHLSQLDWLWAEPTGVWNHVTPYYSIILQYIWWLFAWIKNPWLKLRSIQSSQCHLRQTRKLSLHAGNLQWFCWMSFLHVSTPGSLRRIVWHLRSQIRRLENCRAPLVSVAIVACF